MNKKLIFRILGAISSALIVVSVFLPYVSVSGYSESLWGIYKTIDTLYLPIMIMVFGIIGIVFFALNIKTEFAYSTAGAVLFFTLMQTFDIINQDTFNTLSVGYYFLGIGSILTGVMAFLCNLKSKSLNQNAVTEQNNPVDTPMLNQIDKMYSDQNTVEENIPVIQTVDNSIQPLPVQSIPEQVSNPVPNVNVTANGPIPDLTQINPVPVQPVTPIQNQVSEPIPEIQQPVPVMEQPQSSVNTTIQPEVNQVVQEFNQSNVNPVVKDFMVNQSMGQNNGISVNTQNQLVEPTQNINVPLTSINEANVNETNKVNPVVEEFTNPSNQGLQINQDINNNNGTDIFGQPINK